MNPCFLDCEQCTKAWFDARLGCATSSRIADIVAKRKRVKDGEKVEELACRRNMRWELVCELLTGKPHPHYVNRWMKEGKAKEPFARIEYERRNGVFVEQVGFAPHPQIKMAGASPDGITGDEGLLEIKCPTMNTHLEYVFADVIPEEYLPQLVWQLGCCPDFNWIDFVSFYEPMPEEDDRFAIELPDHLKYFQKRLERTDKVDALIGAYEREVEVFNEDVQAMLQKLTQRASEALQEVTA